MAAHFTSDHTDVNPLVELCIQDSLVPTTAIMLHLAQDSALWMCTHIGSRVPHHQFSNIIIVADFLG